MKSESIQVAVRVRPLSALEAERGCHACTVVDGTENYIDIGHKSYAFDKVFDADAPQTDLYGYVEPHIKRCFNGFNATVLAYGQTGSGKTYTMGTGFSLVERSEETGILPRAISEIFAIIANERELAAENGLPEPEYQLGVQFIEVYQDTIRNLLKPHSGNKNMKKVMQTKIMRQHKSGEMTSVEAVSVTAPEEVLELLRTGCLNRTTGSTSMNSCSSRSHAIFTLNLFMKKDKRLELLKEKLANGSSGESSPEGEPPDEAKTEPTCDSSVDSTTENGEDAQVRSEEDGGEQGGLVTFVSKFTFVDLAGSERAYRTQSSGVTFSEGVSINTGLHHLGTVIASLARNADHIPYRNSKLTYMLADAFGGNSRTVFIACISASDADLAESLNTLSYANEAKRIKNKVSMNRKDSSQTLMILQKEVERLRKELDDIREGRKLVMGNEIVENDMFYERQVNMERIRELEMKQVAMSATIEKLNREIVEWRMKAAMVSSGNSSAGETSEFDNAGLDELLRQQIEDNTSLRAKNFELQTSHDKLKEKLMNMSSLKGLEDFSVDSVTSPGPSHPLRPTSEAAQNMGIAQAVAVAKEELEKMKNQLITAQGQENGAEGEEEENVSSESSEEEESEQDSGQENEEIRKTRGGAMQLHRQMAALTTLVKEVEMAGMRMTKIRDTYEKHILKLQQEIAQAKVQKHPEAPRPPPSHSRTDLSFRAPKTPASHSLKPSASVPAMPRTFAPPPTPPSSRKVNPIRKVSSRSRVPPEMSKSASSATVNVPAQESEKVRTLMEQLNARTEEKKQVDAALKELTKKCEVSKKEAASIRKEWLRQVEELKRLKLVEAEKMQKNFSGKIGALQKIQQKQDRKISKLESESQKTKEMLRQKETELSSTKKQIKELMKSNTARAGKGRKKKVPATKESIWKEMSNSFAEMAIKRGSTQALCQQLGVYLNKRNESYRSLEKYRLQRDETENGADKAELEERVVNATEEFDFFTRTIQEMNELIAAAEQIEYQHVSGTHEHYLKQMETIGEPRFFMENLMKKCVAQATALYLQNQKLVDMKSVVDEHEKNIEMKQQLLEYLCHLHSDEIDAELEADGEDLVDIEPDLESICSPNPFTCDDDQATVILGKSDSSERLISPFDSLSSSHLSLPPTKLRQKTKTVPELLYGIDDSSRPESPHFHLEDPGDIFINPLSESHRKALFEEISALTPSTHSDSITGNGSMESSMSSQASGIPFQFDLEDNSSSSSSPSMTRSLNVFQRLSSVPGTAPILPTKGSVLPFVASLSSTFNNNLSCGSSRRARSRYGTSSLCCELVATGHAAAVKSIHATEDLLVSGSKDCTVKVWDLRTTSEVMSFSHQRPVKSVKMMRNDPNTVISASGPLVRLWDLRSGTCTKTLTSQGLEWEPGTNVFSPRGMITEEVTALEVVDGSVPTLFVAAGDRVRLWNLNSLMAVASLNHPFNKGVRCLAACVVDEEGTSSVNVATGCKDHTARVFKLNLEQVKGAVQASTVLEPPFYDEITAMKVMQNTLYAASRDGCMKKWRLGEREAMQTISGPQNVRITCMCCDEYHGVVLTGDKKGNVKVWSHTPEATQCLDDFLAHETGGVNDLSYNSSFVFSASDVDIKFWKPSSRIEYLNIMFRSA